MNWLRHILRLFGREYRYHCLRCDWLGNQCSWTDSSDPMRSHLPICPRCCMRIKR
jgi:hypothetical protein